MSASLVEFSSRGGVLYAQLDNYARRNALSAALLEELVGGARSHLARERTAVIVISGKGGVFSSGVDVTTVKGHADGDVIGTHLSNDAFGRAAKEFAGLPMVKIAQIEGHCLGAGVVLAAHCNVRFSSKDTMFCLPELDLGAPFSGTGMDLLSYLFGPTKAIDLVLTARRFPASEAAESGFLTAITEPDALAERVRKYAERLASRPPFLVMQTALAAQASMATAVRPPNGEFSASMLAYFDPRSRDQNRLFTSRYSGSPA